MLKAYYDAHPEVLERQVSYRFRSVEQYLPVSLANHLELTRHAATVEPEVAVADV